jgi:Whirly transcription factor
MRSHLRSFNAIRMSSTSNNRIYTRYGVYTPTSAITFAPILPVFTLSPLEDSSQCKPGSLLLSIANSIEPIKNRYDWDTKGTFALSVHDCGTLLTMDKTMIIKHAAGGKDGVDIAIKKLTVTRDASNGVVFNLIREEKGSNINTNHTIRLSPGQMKALQVSIEFLIPRLLGFDAIFSR